MLVKKKNEKLALKLDKPVRIASATVLIVIIAGLIIKERAHFVDYFSQAWEIALSLNIATMLVGFLSAKIFRLNFKQSLCISIESGNQNGTLAIFIAATTLGRPELAIAAAVYSLIMFLTPVVLIVVGNSRVEKDSSSEVVE